MIKEIYEAFIFRKENKLLYRLDPRVKILFLINMIILISLLNTFVGQLAISLYIVVLGAIGYTYDRFKRVLKMATLVSLVFLLILFFIHVWLGYTMCDSLSISGFLVLRLANLMIIFSLVFSTTSPEDIVQLLIKLRVPYMYAYMFTLTIKFIPIIARDIQSTYEAHKARGLIVDYGLNPIKRVRSLIPFFISIFTIILNRVNSVAEALESRCFGLTVKRTFLNELRINRIDIVFMLTTLACSVILYGILSP